MSRRLTTEDFIEKARSVHGDRYDYSLVEYSTTHKNVLIRCKDHGVFEQTPDNHVHGKGCSICVDTARSYHRHIKAKNRRDWNFEQPLDYKLIPLTQGKFSKVDNEDFDRVKDINWSYAGGYATNTNYGLMHRFIIGTPEGMLVDHKEIENTLDNRKSNLRLATKQQNQHNQRPQRGRSSQYKGVSKYKQRDKWVANIEFNGKTYFIGYFDDEVECTKAYDRKALELFGEFAYLNFPELKQEYLKQIKEENG